MPEAAISADHPTAVPPRRTASERLAARRRLPSVRLLIILIVVIPVAMVSSLLVWIAISTSRDIAEELGHEIVVGATDQVSADIRNYLDAAIRVSDLYEARVRDRVLPTDRLEAWERPMFHDLAANKDVASICFSNPNGDCTWLLHAHNRLELGLVDGKARDKAIEYAATSDGTVDRTKPLRVYHYDATKRPWYTSAVVSEEAAWTPIYFWFQEGNEPSVVGTGYTRMIRDKNDGGRLLGVLVIDVTLEFISQHLRKLPIVANTGGHVFIVDEQGLMVAASDEKPMLTRGKSQERISLAESDSPVAKTVAPIVTPWVQGPNSDPSEAKSARVLVDNLDNRVQVTEIKPFPGIHWHIVTVLPEERFLASAHDLQQRAVIFAVAAVVGGLLLGLVLSRRLSRPLMQLSQHVARVGGGDFDSRLHLGHASELRRLSDEVNKMASGLQQRLMLEQSLAVATHVQQSLLPSRLPKLRGLELAASSRYCESTGGDYYDFIEIPSFEAHRTLVVVGDVTGHGIGAAMMMSTARGAVRASCQGAPSLGHILTRVNGVLATGAERGMFMTLVLLFVNPDTGYATWASAGHDPVIVYHPDTDAFEELRSGDMPLGIEPDIVCREFSRACAQTNSIFLIGTDGIWEARNAHGEMFGKHRLREVIRNNAASAERVSEAIKRAMQSHTQNLPLLDDVTYVVLRVTPPAVESA